VPAEPGWHCAHWLFCSAEPSEQVQAVPAELGELDGHAVHTPSCISDPSAQVQTVALASEVLPVGHAVSAWAPASATKKSCRVSISTVMVAAERT
jgi:hypothetical protein